MLGGCELLDRTIAINNRVGDQRTFQLLDDELLNALANIHLRTEKKRKELLQAREKRQREYDQGYTIKSSKECTWKDNPDWKAQKISSLLKKRSREIFVSANDSIQLIKLINQFTSRNSKNSSSNESNNIKNTFTNKRFSNTNLQNQVEEDNVNLILDFEDLINNNWSNVIDGIFTAKGVLLGDLLYREEDADKKIQLHQLKNKLPANSQFIIRIRNIEKTENTITINNQKMAASLFDIVTNSYYLLNILKDQGRGLHFYIPKCDHYLEARYYQQILAMIEEHFSLPSGTLKVTVQIDTFNAFDQAEEILYELKNYCAGLYIYPLGMLHSYHKMFRNYNEMILPNLSGIAQQDEWPNNLYAKLSDICKKREIQLLIGYNNFLIHEGLSKIEKSIIINNLKDEFKRIESFNIDGIVLYHQSLLSLLDEVQTFAKDQIRININSININSDKFTSRSSSNHSINDKSITSFLPKNHGPKTLNELRFYIRKGILFIESVQRNKAPLYSEYATFTPLAFDIIRWHTWHWIYHKATIEEWGPLNKNFVKKLFEDEYERLLFEQKEKGTKISHNLIEHWNEAKEKAKQLFTSDLLVDHIF